MMMKRDSQNNKKKRNVKKRTSFQNIAEKRRRVGFRRTRKGFIAFHGLTKRVDDPFRASKAL
jgi:hypothetical protein